MFDKKTPTVFPMQPHALIMFTVGYLITTTITTYNVHVRVYHLFFFFFFFVDAWHQPLYYCNIVMQVSHNNTMINKKAIQKQVKYRNK